MFGCLAYAHVPKDVRQTFDSKSRRCIFLGYGTTTKGYRLYDVKQSKVFYSRDVIFDESKSGGHEESEVPLKPIVCINSGSDNESTVETIEPMEGQEEPLGRRPVREIRRPDRYGEWVNLACDNSERSSVHEAMASRNKDKWRRAMENALKSLHDNKVWELVELPKGKKTIGSKWVFKEKVGADGTNERYKARLVAQGYVQQGLDYDEMFSPVVRPESVRTMVALSARNKLLLHQMDVV